MAITRVDAATGNACHCDNGGFGTDNSGATSRQINVGEKIFIYYTGKSAFGAVASITGLGGSNSATLAAFEDDGTRRTEIWYCDVVSTIASGTTLHVNTTTAGGGTSHAAVVGYTGLKVGAPEATGGNTGFGSPQDSGTTGATTTASSLVTAVWCEQTAGTVLSSVATGYTVGTVVGTADGFSLNEAYKVVAATGTQDAVATPSGGDSWASAIVTWPADTGAPVNTVPPAVTGTATVGQTLSCSTGTWTGDTSSGFAYQWQRDVAGNGVYSNIGGATASTRVLASADDGCHLRCVVTATGTGGSTAANSNASPIVTFAIPSGGSVAVTGTAVVGHVLTATTSGWSPAPASYAFTWQRADDAAFTTNVVTVRGPTSQPGTTDPYTVQLADDGKYLRARVTATDDGGTSGAVNSAATAQVTQGPPVNVVPPSISGTPIVGGLLAVTPGQWT